MTTDINMEKLQQDAVDIFHQGFACSESVIYAIKKNFELDMSDDAIAMSSGFPWGLGGGGCICGALAGATMCIGYFFEKWAPSLSYSMPAQLLSLADMDSLRVKATLLHPNSSVILRATAAYPSWLSCPPMMSLSPALNPNTSYASSSLPIRTSTNLASSDMTWDAFSLLQRFFL